jgi:hypothetical protein
VKAEATAHKRDVCKLTRESVVLTKELNHLRKSARDMQVPHIHIYTYIYIYTHIHIYIYTSIKPIPIYTYISTSIHLYIY